MDVIFYEAFEEEENELKKYLPGKIKAEFTWKTIQESKHKLTPAKLISTRTQSIFPLEWGSKLSGILSRSTGYEHLMEYQQNIEKKLILGYLPLYCHRAVAEHAMMLWMALLRKLRIQQNNFATFYRDGITGYECEKKTLLVVGVGNIGGQVVRIGRGLGMKILCVDIDIKYPEEQYISIEEGIQLADVIVCSMNLTEQNRNYFTYELLKKAKKNAIFVNVSRGEFSKSSILLKLANENHLGGIGLDVFYEEKELANCLRNNIRSNNSEVQATIELSKLNNAILTPHNAFNTYESVERKASQSIEQIVHFLDTGKFLWPVPEI
jgi:D-lactate dehydrogenase